MKTSVYLGIKLFRGAPSTTPGVLEEAPETSPAKVFAHSVAVTALNPKSIVFFIAFVPQFVTPQAALVPQFAVLITTFVGLAAINALAYAVLADKLRHRIARPAVLSIPSRLGGGALIAVGVATATFRRSAP